jgi:hypothetical protein
MNGTNPATAISSPDVASLPVHFGWAIAIAVALSLVLASIEITNEAKKPFRSCLVTQSFFYALLLATGNVITTLLSATVVSKLGASLTPYYFLLAAFIGVFAFQSILKNMNITILDKGVLTIQDWLDKAKSGAAAAAILHDIERIDLARGSLAQQLATVPESKLNALLASKLPVAAGGSIVAQLDAAAVANSADPQLYKAYALVEVISPSVITAFLQSLRPK